MKRALAVALCVALIGSIVLTYPEGASTSAPRTVEVTMAPLASGSSGGLNGTDGSASVAGSLLSLRTDVLWLNNTNATGAWYAKLISTGTTGLSNAAALAIGIDNGTSSTSQVTASAGALTKTDGTYVRLEPGSANKIYVTQAVTLLGPDTTVTLEVRAADSTAEEAYVSTTATLTVT